MVFRVPSSGLVPVSHALMLHDVYTARWAKVVPVKE